VEEADGAYKQHRQSDDAKKEGRPVYRGFLGRLIEKDAPKKEINRNSRGNVTPTSSTRSRIL